MRLTGMLLVTHFMVGKNIVERAWLSKRDRVHDMRDDVYAYLGALDKRRPKSFL